jgi:cell wall-associated NlpC family hydrolase
MTPLDPRLHAHRPDLADATLEGRCEATNFVSATQACCCVPVAGIFRAPAVDAMQTSQLLLGENVNVFERKNGWAWVQVLRDSYVGYVAESSLTSGSSNQTHQVCVRSAHLYPQANLKTQPARAIPMNAQLRVTRSSNEYLETQTGEFVFASHVSTNPLTDVVAIAEQFLHSPYLWGGKTVWGIDCSGLVQTALHACGLACPRDSDMQEANVGHAVGATHLQRADLVFWKGHVGIMQDAETLLHANGHHLQVVSEPLERAVSRIAAKGSAITSIKRFL